MVSRLFTYVKVALVALGLALNAAPASAQGKGPYRVLVITSLSGPLAFQGKITLAGIQAGVDDINAHGGYMGMPIEVSTLDSQADPVKAVSGLQAALASGAKPNLVFSGWASAESLAIAPILKQEKILGFTAAGSDRLRDISPYMFTATAEQVAHRDQVAEFLASKKPSKVGILTASDAYGTDAGNNAAAALTRAGIKFVSEKMDPKAIDVSASLQRLQDQGVDYLLYDALAPQVGYVLKSRSKLGWKVPVVGGAAVGSFDTASLVTPADLEGVMVQYPAGLVVGSALQKRPVFGRMYSAVKSKMGGPITGLMMTAAEGWDMMHALGAAIKSANSIEADAVVTALEKLRLPPEGDSPVTLWEMSWKPGRHKPQGSKSDWMIIPASHFVEGLIKQ